MTIRMGNLKKALLTKFDRTIKEATARAIPVIKKETIKQIANSTTISDSMVDILTVAALGVGIFVLSSSPAPTKAKLIGDTAQTIVNIENLNLYFKE